jgi:methylenetetrahydrofolate reductase (NADPH)
MQKITDVLSAKDHTYSFELFPPKTPERLEALYTNVAALTEMRPDYVSVTYGAGGTTSKSTRAIIDELHRRFDLTCMHHLTLVNQRKEELAEIIRQIKADAIRNILALRGDPPPEMGGHFRQIEDGLEFCYELIDLIRGIGGDYFSIGVAGFPEGHPDCPSKELDTEHLKLKIDHGAEFVVTQFFFENEVYSEYLERTSRAGLNVRIIPGVLPITDYDRLLKFAATCGAYICDLVHETFGPLREDPEMTVRQGVEYAINQCEDLLRRGAPGIHFYCLNQVEPVRTIWRQISGEAERSTKREPGAGNSAFPLT